MNGWASVRAMFQPYLPTDFVTTWRTTGANESITLPLIAGHVHNFTVAWGDGSTSVVTAYNDADRIHTYAAAGDHTVVITGTTAAWDFFTVSTSRLKIRAIVQWGTNPWTSLYEAFYDCDNLAVTASDAPNLAGVTNLGYMFSACGTGFSINAVGLARWDISGILLLSSMFEDNLGFTGAGLGGWDTSNVFDMGGFALGATAFVGSEVSSWDLSGCNYIAGFAYGCPLFTGAAVISWDVSGIEYAGTFATGITPANYDAILNAWAAQDVQPGIDFGVGATKYTAAGAAARAILAGAPNSWTIVDGGLL